MSVGDNERSVVERTVAAVERHPARAVVWSAVAAIVSLASAFIGGFSCHKDLIESAGMDSVPRGTYILRSDLSAYIPKSEVQENFISKDVVKQEYVSRSIVGSDYLRKSDCPGTLVNSATSTVEPKLSTDPAASRSSAPLVKEEQGFSFELVRCTRTSTAVICQLTVTNTHEEERGINIWALGREPSSRIIDGRGAQYYSTQATLAGMTHQSPGMQVPAHIRVRFSLRFPNVAIESNDIAVVQVLFSHSGTTYKIEFRGVQIAA